jgi:multifunctional beta-oxidation protein
MVDMFKPDFVAPIVGYLTSKGKRFVQPQLRSLSDFRLANEGTSGRLFEVTGGWAAETRWQRSGGHGFPHNQELTPEAVLAKWDKITGFCKISPSSLEPVMLMFRCS